jgi:hypothetical protein
MLKSEIKNHDDCRKSGLYYQRFCHHRIWCISLKKHFSYLIYFCLLINNIFASQQNTTDQNAHQYTIVKLTKIHNLVSYFTNTKKNKNILACECRSLREIQSWRMKSRRWHCSCWHQAFMYVKSIWQVLFLASQLV